MKSKFLIEYRLEGKLIWSELVLSKTEKSGLKSSVRIFRWTPEYSPAATVTITKL